MCNSFAHIIRVSETWKAVPVFSTKETSDLSKFINMKRLSIKLGKKRHAVSYNKTFDAFFFG